MCNEEIAAKLTNAATVIIRLEGKHGLTPPPEHRLTEAIADLQRIVTVLKMRQTLDRHQNEQN